MDGWMGWSLEPAFLFSPPLFVQTAFYQLNNSDMLWLKLVLFFNLLPYFRNNLPPCMQLTQLILDNTLFLNPHLPCTLLKPPCGNGK